VLIIEAAEHDGLILADGDVVVIAQKIVSKAEGRIVHLADVIPSPRAEKLARLTGRDARLCQLYLDESTAITAVNGRHVVTVHRLGFVGTGAGVDMSNVGERADGNAVLLPADPDASARAIRSAIKDRTGATIAIIICDSFGSPVRDGAIGAAIGIAGIRHVEQPENDADLFGNPSKPMMNRVDEIASAASILMGQTAAARPVVVGRGVPYTVDEHASIARLLTEQSPSAIDYDLAADT
jgi:coenzyme F420-0:L-glutamate ligase/coenzyme F420-1:gamma-L-glutamate ligase